MAFAHLLPDGFANCVLDALVKTNVDHLAVEWVTPVVPRIPSLRVLQVPAGFDVADNEIVKRAAAGDLVITADVPLAAEIIGKGGEALNPRGERYSPDTIRGVLTMRDFMDTMRSSGNVGGGPPPLTQADRNAFASHLDKWLARQ